MTLPQSGCKYVLRVCVACVLSAGLSMTAAAATQLTFNPSILRFGEVVLGQGESLRVTVTNSGSASLNISTIGVA